MSGKKLFVWGISWNLTEEELQEVFAQAWTVVSVKIITDRETGRSKGFWFVEMETDEEAQKAIEALNGQEVDWRSITVNIARPMEKKPFERG